VEPEWMLLTHYPDHEHYQLTGRHLSRDEFLALPPVNVLYRTYGIDTHRLFQMALDHHLTLPFFYNKG
jgi:transglutaminase/protease-like cytokinesis protein 3